MSTTVPPGDSGAMPAPQLTVLADEDALHRAFLAEYPTLMAEANADLGNDAAALGPRVVEGAFVRAWDARTRLGTPDQLHEFLTEDVHHAAARALSRRAIAHRMAGHSAPETAHAQHALATTDADHAWSHILSALHDEGHSERALAESAAISRHEAAEHIAHVETGRPWWIPVALGVALVAALVGVMFWIDHITADSRLARAVNGTDVRDVTAVPGQIGVVTLNDGSTVRLAPESKLVIPKEFGPDLRAVKLEGAAAFAVAPGVKNDFQVHAGNTVVVAKGTAFTVRAYPDDPTVTVVVSEGAVEVRHGGQSQQLAPGGALVVGGTTPAHTASPAERDATDAWRTGTFAVSNQPLGDVLPLLRRWYGLDIKVQHAPLLSRPVTVRASLDSSRQAIRGIEQSTGLEFGYVDTTMVFREPAKKPVRRR
ncbi:MAG TPA: FecR domain-containing protein [Candidatus Elarobacter sp.]|nr:FecR domain-containing protein [Candidatus Elarobacter sp.]